MFPYDLGGTCIITTQVSLVVCTCSVYLALRVSCFDMNACLPLCMDSSLTFVRGWFWDDVLLSHRQSFVCKDDQGCLYSMMKLTFCPTLLSLLSPHIYLFFPSPISLSSSHTSLHSPQASSVLLIRLRLRFRNKRNSVAQRLALTARPMVMITHATTLLHAVQLPVSLHVSRGAIHLGEVQLVHA